MQNDNPLFELGQLCATPGALEALAAAGARPSEYLTRHIAGDYGDMCLEDKQENDIAVLSGDGRVFSAYRVNSELKIWIITESDRSLTTILLPEEY